MKDPDKVNEWIDRYNNHELEGDELKEFEELLRTDPALRAEVQLDREIDQALSDTDTIEFRKKILAVKRKSEEKDPGRNAWLLAAAILLLAGIAVLLYFSLGTHDRENDKTAGINGVKSNVSVIPGGGDTSSRDRSADSARPASGTKQLLAGNFRPHPALENLVGAQVRSGYFRLLTPAAGAGIGTGNPVDFTWETAIRHPLELIIMDNRGNTAFRSHPTTEKKIAVPAGVLTNGLYYYKILDDNEIVFVGKFTIGSR
jgi:hypothetical protein